MRVTTSPTQTERKRRTGLSVALKNVATRPGRGGFAARSAQLRAFARPRTPLRAKNACSAGAIRRY
jgi:hypothetical protein